MLFCGCLSSGAQLTYWVSALSFYDRLCFGLDLLLDLCFVPWSERASGCCIAIIGLMCRGAHVGGGTNICFNVYSFRWQSTYGLSRNFFRGWDCVRTFGYGCHPWFYLFDVCEVILDYEYIFPVVSSLLISTPVISFTLMIDDCFSAQSALRLDLQSIPFHVVCSLHHGFRLGFSLPSLFSCL